MSRNDTWTRTVELTFTAYMATTPTSLRTASTRADVRRGALLAVASMVCVQLGLAASVGLFDDVGPEGAACLRLVFAGLLLLALVRPRMRSFSRGSLAATVALGAGAGAPVRA